jgi:hypothetical protein
MEVKEKHVHIELNDSGDSKHIWDEDNEAEVAAAKAIFDMLKKKGYVAYAVNKKGDKGEAMDEFDPSAEKMILAPQMKGG